MSLTAIHPTLGINLDELKTITNTVELKESLEGTEKTFKIKEQDIKIVAKKL